MVELVSRIKDLSYIDLWPGTPFCLAWRGNSLKSGSWLCCMELSAKAVKSFLFAVLAWFFMCFIQRCFICRPSDSNVSEDAGIKLRTVVTLALAARCSNHSAKSHPLTRVNVMHQKIVDFSNLLGVNSLVVSLLSVTERYKTIYHCFHRGLECWEGRGGPSEKWCFWMICTSLPLQLVYHTS